MFEIDERDANTAETGGNTAGMALFEGDPINVVGDLDTQGGEADANNALVFLEQRRFWRWIVEAEVNKDLLQSLGVARRVFDKEIDVARVTSVAMVGDGVAADDDVADTVPVKQPYKIAEVCRQWDHSLDD